MIPLSSAGAYPTTEQTPASVSVLLNGGGLAQLQEINRTFATALAGRGGRHAACSPNSHVHHRAEQADRRHHHRDREPQRPGRPGRSQNQVVDTALTTIPQALPVLADSRTNRRRHRRARQVQRRRHPTIDQSRDALVANLRNIAPSCALLAGDAGPALTRSLDFPSHLPLGQEHDPELVPRRLLPTSPWSSTHPEPAGQRPVHWQTRLRQPTELELQWGRTIGQMPSPTGGNLLTAPVPDGRYR